MGVSRWDWVSPLGAPVEDVVDEAEEVAVLDETSVVVGVLSMLVVVPGAAVVVLLDAVHPEMVVVLTTTRQTKVARRPSALLRSWCPRDAVAPVPLCGQPPSAVRCERTAPA